MTRRHTGIPPRHRTAPVMEDLKELGQMPPRSRKGDRLSALEKLAMLHGFDLGMPMIKIANRWNLSQVTVSRFNKSLADDPLSVFKLRVVQRIGNGLFQCRMCGEPRSRLVQAQRHLLSHFFAPVLAQNIDLIRSNPPLSWGQPPSYQS